MRITISGRNIDLTDGLKGAVEEKLSKLEKYFTPDTDVYVTLSVEKERAGQQRYVCVDRSCGGSHRAAA